MRSSRKLALATATWLFATIGVLQAHEAAEDMTSAASRWVAALTPEQRTEALFKLEDPERRNWHFVPRDRKGLSLKAMTPPQRHLAMGLLGTALSHRGLLEATTIMSLEDVLRETERGTGPVRDPELYFLSVFGEPAAHGTWGWRFEGHHLSLNFTLAGDHMAVTTPSFFGANPAKVARGPRAGLRVLADEEDAARALLDSLSDAQRREAVFDTRTYGDIVTANAESVDPLAPVGIAAARLSDAQRAQLMKLVEVYARTFEPGLAEARVARVREGGVENVRFGWAGATEPGKQHYYRVQGPLFLIEYDATQNGGNHVHTVWRDFAGDFGRDLLREHYGSAQGTAHRHQ